MCILHKRQSKIKYILNLYNLMFVAVPTYYMLMHDTKGLDCMCSINK